MVLWLENKGVQDQIPLFISTPCALGHLPVQYIYLFGFKLSICNFLSKIVKKIIVSVLHFLVSAFAFVLIDIISKADEAYDIN